MSGAKRVRFAGKVFGQKKDYWVAQGVLPEVAEPNQPENIETRGKGLNLLVFWVTDNILNDWIQLPDVCPEHIMAARMFQHVLSGDLNATIESNPPFPGKERHFLRAQLARIFSATTISPKGLFEMNEESGEMQYAEEFAMPSSAELKLTETWVNTYPQILKNGRTTHYVPSVLPEEEREALLAGMAEADPQTDPFRAINEQPAMPGLEICWVSRVAGDT